MKISRFVAVLILLCFVPNVALAATPYIPVYAGSAVIPMYSRPSVFPVPQVTSYTTNQIGNMSTKMKGIFGEELMNNYFTRGLDMASGKRWYSIQTGAVRADRNGVPVLLSEGSKSIQGIDGLMLQFDSKGNISNGMVIESKYGSSLQRQTRTGLQGSLEYNAPRLRAASEYYARLSKHIRDGNIKLVSGQPPRGSEVVQIPLSDKKSVTLWWDKSQGKYFYSDNSIDTKNIISKSNTIAKYLRGMADGKIAYNNRLFKTSIKGNFLNISMESLDPNGVTERHLMNLLKPYAELSAKLQESVKDAFIAAKLEQYRKLYIGISDAEIENMARKEIERLENQGRIYDALKKDGFNDLRFAWGAAGKVALKSGAIGAAMALAFRTAASLWYGLSFDYVDFAKDALIGFTSAGGGTLTTIGVNYFLEKQLLTSSQSLLMRMIPQKWFAPVAGMAGGLIATAIFSYGYAFLYGTGWTQANRMMITGSVATLVASGVSSFFALSGLFSFGVGFVTYAVVSSLFSYVWASFDERERIDSLKDLVYSYHD